MPTNVGVAPREQAIFHCQYLTADYVLWHVNGTVVRRNYHPDITPGTTRDDNDELVDTLTITAHPEYNGTEVVCVAGFDDGRPEEPSGTVFLLGIIRPDQFNLLLLGYCEVEIGASDRKKKKKKAINWVWL